MRPLPNPPRSASTALTNLSTTAGRGPGIGAIPGGGLGAAPLAFLPFTLAPSCAMLRLHSVRGEVMADPLSRPVFDAIMARAGIVLSEAEAEGIRAASAHVQRFAAAVRVVRPVSAEPAVVFAP